MTAKIYRAIIFDTLKTLQLPNASSRSLEMISMKFYCSFLLSAVENCDVYLMWWWRSCSDSFYCSTWLTYYIKSWFRSLLYSTVDFDWICSHGLKIKQLKWWLDLILLRLYKINTIYNLNELRRCFRSSDASSTELLQTNSNSTSKKPKLLRLIRLKFLLIMQSKNSLPFQTENNKHRE